MAAKNGGTVVCPGSYDPVTMGHIDIIGRVSQVFDQVIVAVVNQPVRKQKTALQRSGAVRDDRGGDREFAQCAGKIL